MKKVNYLALNIWVGLANINLIQPYSAEYMSQLTQAQAKARAAVSGRSTMDEVVQGFRERVTAMVAFAIVAVACVVGGCLALTQAPWVSAVLFMAPYLTMMVAPYVSAQLINQKSPRRTAWGFLP